MRQPKRTPSERVLDFLTTRGLPAPEPEYLVAPGVRLWRFDFAWPALRVALEIDGGGFAGGRHTTGKGHQEDCRKLSEAAARGWLIVRGTPGDIRSGLTLGYLERTLRRAMRSAESETQRDTEN